jgi:nucleoside-diphosphate-sugar epimerase
MKILITGSTGFIGNHLIKKLLFHKYEILIISRSKEIKKITNVKYCFSDLKNINKKIDVIRKFNPSVCVHLAWSGIPEYNLKNCKSNFIDNLVFINFLKLLNLKKIIISGSCMEYGEIPNKVKESQTSQYLNQFGLTKKYIQELYFSAFKNEKTKIIWCRIFYVYGPGQRKTSLIPSIISEIKKNKILKLKNPEISNDYVYIDDVINAFYLFVNKNVRDGIYNLSSGKLTNNNELLNIIMNLFGKKGNNLKFRKKGLSGNISKTKKNIGWLAKTNIKNGLKKTIF